MLTGVAPDMYLNVYQAPPTISTEPDQSGIWNLEEI